MNIINSMQWHDLQLWFSTKIRCTINHTPRLTHQLIRCSTCFQTCRQHNTLIVRYTYTRPLSTLWRLSKLTFWRRKHGVKTVNDIYIPEKAIAFDTTLRNANDIHSLEITGFGTTLSNDNHSLLKYSAQKHSEKHYQKHRARSDQVYEKH